MQFYPTREWKRKKALVTLRDEKRVIDLMEVSDEEFREFILWKLGVALDEPHPPKLLVGENVQGTIPASILRKVREYDRRLTQAPQRRQPKR